MNNKEEKGTWITSQLEAIFSTPIKSKVFWYKGVYYNLETGEPSWEAIKAVGKEMLGLIEKDKETQNGYKA